ncbi:hypothetical protein E0Z10_g3891 [Xylaria hypoxylon]|uniref:Uncharacterized protein n=1 Tax=Xylaria hypoxylon TaxID=37992 RepID=A0A4Z0Z679_9PEZI|nr:hypothetical protein E0Z10_g3891 [Xylaria hypoxylon]
MADAFFSGSIDDPSSYKVHLGIWTNWSRGPVFGATLTVDRRQGSLLISFTAFFVTVVASRFWRIICLILHRKLSSAENRDALHHQRQAIFRNSSSSGSGLWSLMQISWAWPSGFSSSISTAIGNEVLIDGTNCGYIDIPSLDVLDVQRVLEPWQSKITNNAAGYAQQVYSPNRTGVFGNTVFVKKRLNTISNSEAPCPFKDNDQSILYRVVTHCAPLDTEGRSEPTEHLGISNYTGYKYGPSTFTENSNYTLIIRDTYSQNIAQTNGFAFSGYGLELTYSLTVDGTSTAGTFQPEPDLQRSDADIYMFFLSGNGVVTNAPLNDPWYRSNIQSKYNRSSFGSDGSSPIYNTETVYQPAEAASPLGCTLQIQVCKGTVANNNSCGPLASLNDGLFGALPFFDIDPEDFSKYDTMDKIIEAYSSNNEASRFLWFLQILQNYPAQIAGPAQQLGSQSLASYTSLTAQIQGPLPDDQWKLDVSNWWNITLALIQASFVDTANGPTDPNVAIIKTNATNSGQKSLCQNQKIVSTSYISVSLFGLYFTYITGSLIIIASFVLEPLLSYVQKRWKKREYENLEWMTNQTLQLQRLAYEESGQGEWSKCLDSIPVTASDQELSPLNLTDPEHPRLRHPQSPRFSKEIPFSFAFGEEHGDVFNGQGEGGLQEEEEYQDVQVSPLEFDQELTEEPRMEYGTGESHVDDSHGTFFTSNPGSPVRGDQFADDLDHSPADLATMVMDTGTRIATLPEASR